jgi:hypothetical protein
LLSWLLEIFGEHQVDIRVQAVKWTPFVGPRAAGIKV